MIVVEGVGYAVDRPLLADVDLTVEPGRLVALSGPSGSGKTLLLSVIGGLLQPTAGTVTLDGVPTWRGTGDPPADVSFVLQVYGLVPILSARENVSVALRARGVAPGDADDRAEAALADLHLADLGDRQVEELSGGQLQRVAIARALVVRTPVLLADEPTSELDPTTRVHVMSLLRARADAGAAVVVATHDPEVVEACDDHHRMADGRLVLARHRAG